MEPVDARLAGLTLPPPNPIAGAGAASTAVPPESTAWPAPGSQSSAGATAAVLATLTLRGMARWRVLGAVALCCFFGLSGWQVQRLIADHRWSDSIMWLSVAAGVAAAGCVLVWTWSVTENARRLVGPAAGRDVPDPRVAVRTWLVPFGFIALSIAVVASLGSKVDPNVDQTVAAIPLAVAVLAILLAIPLTYRPMNYLAGVIRQVGGSTVRVVQWLWVPVVLAAAGIGSIVAMRFGLEDEPAATAAEGWAPLWVVAIVAIAPCVIVVLLAWRAAMSVEVAVAYASSLRRHGRNGTGMPKARPMHRRRTMLSNLNDTNKLVRLLPGADLLRLCVVTLLAGLALLSVVGAAVMGIAWSEARDGRLLPADRRRAWDTIDLLRDVSQVVVVILLTAVTVWTFVAVFNARRATGRRLNPLIAAAVWPAAALGLRSIADRMIIDQSIGRVILGLAVQAVVLGVPFLVLEHSADVIGARRTPIRISFVFGVVLLVHFQGLGAPASITELAGQELAGTGDFSRAAGYLLIGAVVQLMSTMAVTEACGSLTRTSLQEAEHHNMLVAQRVSSPVSPPPIPSR